MNIRVPDRCGLHPHNSVTLGTSLMLSAHRTKNYLPRTILKIVEDELCKLQAQCLAL